jgi:lipoprotein-anchoring transpeptidase ErfK/SrfK
MIDSTIRNILAGLILFLVAAFQVGEATAQDLRLELSQTERELYVFLDEEIIEIYPVAIGQPSHPTPTGTFTIHQVDWNPDWTPPDSDWSADSEYKEPGEPGNPMGRVRLIFEAPYSLHGTEDLDSLGEKASHGSIRLANDDIMDLARLVMEHGGRDKSENWFETAIEDPTTMHEVSLPDPVMLVIYE